MVDPADRRFLADRMLGKLARFLRIFGFDTEYLSKPGTDPVQKAVHEQKILLTRSRELIRRVICTPELVYFDPGHDDAQKQLTRTLNHFDLPLTPVHRPRCPKCNGILKKIESDAVRNKVPDFIAATHMEFKICSCCATIYWRGSHLSNLDIESIDD